MHQSRISQIEDPSYEGLTLTTAKRIASALDVALAFRLLPFSRFADFLVDKTWISASDWTVAIPALNDDKDLVRHDGRNETVPVLLHEDATIPSYQPPLPLEVSPPVATIHRDSTLREVRLYA
jgi:hypothetical protein